jgi:hypothetical protein
VWSAGLRRGMDAVRCRRREGGRVVLHVGGRERSAVRLSPGPGVLVGLRLVRGCSQLPEACVVSGEFVWGRRLAAGSVSG